MELWNIVAFYNLPTVLAMVTYKHCLLHIWQFPDLLIFPDYYLPEVHVFVTEQSAMLKFF